MDVAGRYVSVALSLRSPSLAVSQHSALWSSDFPRTLQFAIACLTHTHIIRVSHRGLLYKDGDPASSALTVCIKTRYNGN